jgi:hypothetical protein
MSGALQAVFQNQRSFIPPLPSIGAAYGGGFFAGQISTTGNSIATHNLVIGPVASAESTLQWKILNTTTAGTSSVIDGPANTTAMNNPTHPAAQFSKTVSAGGFSDWYMPAKNELEICYYNLKPTTTTNQLGSGINANAVPARTSNYTSGNPAQTSATNFQSGGAEAFTATTYWSSTGSGVKYAEVQFFVSPYAGYQFITYKNASYNIRAVRRIAV